MRYKRFSKALLVIGLSALYTVSTFGATLTDVKPTHWAYSSIVDLESKGIISYNSKGQFLPNETMNYFEVADVLAKATGYVDVDVATNVDPQIKNAIKGNYEKQKPILANMAAKYKNWDKLYDQQVAYLLGRGYIKENDLSKFITSSGTKATLTKQQLAVFIVRMLGKEVTATSTYTTTGFNDENAIAAANRPYMAYLKSLGIINPDAKGNCSPNTIVTKALCAKMVSSGLKAKVNLEGTGKPSENTSTGNEVTGTVQTVIVKKVLSKNANEYFLYLNKDGNNSYYSIKNTTVVTDANGNNVAITAIPLESTAQVTFGLEGATEYVTSMKLGTNANNNGEAVTTPNQDVTTVTGNLLEKINNNIIRLSLVDGSSKAYILSDSCTITLDGIAVSANVLNIGDSIVANLQNTTVTSIRAMKGTGDTSAALTSGEVIEKQAVADGYKLVITNGNNESTVFIPEVISFKRNNKNRDISELRIGDQVQITKKGNTVSLVTATGQQSSISGTIKEIHIAQPGRIVINTGSETITCTLSDTTEIYDSNKRKYITIRDLHLGQEVDVLLESKEVASLDVIKGSSSVNFKGTIKAITRSNDYIDVLVDYDPISGATGVYKHISVPSSVVIRKNGKEVSRSSLDTDMEVVISYEYLDDSSPKSILVID